MSLSKGGKVTAVEPATKTFVTDFGRHKAAVANVMPPQKAGRIADLAGVSDRTGWCPVDPVTFESKQQPNIHVIGDAAIMGCDAEIGRSRPMPRQKSAPRRWQRSSPAKSRSSRS